MMPGALTLLGDIDTPEEAFWVVMGSGFGAQCGITATEVEDGYRLERVNQMGTDGCSPAPISEDTVLVRRDASIQQLESVMLANEITCAIGRRPPGLRSAHRVRTRSWLGEHFARVAHLEAASVPAFAAVAGPKSGY